MIDFIKIAIYDKKHISEVWQNYNLDYHSNTEYRANLDEVKEVCAKTFKNFHLKKSNSCLTISGSLHYFFNNGKHNANEFSVNDCINSIHKLQGKFNLILEKCFVVNLEYGVNLISPIEIEPFIIGLKYHDRNEFIRHPKFKYCKTSGNTKYKTIKAYAKGLQYPKYCDINTFRFEVKSNQSKYIKTLGISSLIDLQKKDIYNTLGNNILSEWNKVLLFDKTTNTGENYHNTDYWETLLNGHRNSFNSAKKRYQKIKQKGLHHKVGNAMTSKIEQLKKCAFSTPLREIQNVHFPTNVLYEYAHSSKCSITGINLNHEKGNANYIRTTTLRYLQKHSNKEFLQLCNWLIPNTGKVPKYENDIISHLAKQIRNRYYNSNQIRQMGYKQPKTPKNQLNLFENNKNLQKWV